MGRNGFKAVKGVSGLYHRDNGMYYARFSVGGKKTWQSLRTKLKSVAEPRLADIKKELREIEVDKDSDSADVTMGDLIKKIEEDIRIQKLKPRTIKYYGECHNAILKTWPGIEDKKVRQMTATAVENWSKKLMNQFDAQRYNNIIGQMRKLLQMGKDQGVLFGDLMKGVRRAKIIPKEISLPDKETFERWLGVIDKARSRWGHRSGQTVRFLAYSGLRRLTEAALVKWGDIDFDGKFIHVKGDPTTRTKNWSTRRVPFNPKLEELLKAMREERPDEPLSSRVLEVIDPTKQMHFASDHLGIPRIKPKDLRDWFGTICVESGVNIPTVAKWMGHKDGGVLLMRTYTHIRDEYSQELAKKVNF